MSTNWDFAIAEAVQTILIALTCSPDVVQIVPAGAEQDEPDGAKSLWMNVSVQDNGIYQETSNSFIGTSIINVTIGVRSSNKIENVAETLTDAATETLSTLSTSTLAGYARRAPTIAIEGYSGGGDANAVFWYSMTSEFEKQVNS